MVGGGKRSRPFRRRPLPRRHDDAKGQGEGGCGAKGWDIDKLGNFKPDGIIGSHGEAIAMLVCSDGGVDVNRLHAIRSWMTLDDLEDAIELRLYQMSWEEAARQNAKKQ